jgi:hypothetical protein
MSGYHRGMDALVALLEKNYDGEPWHGPSLKSVLDGIDAKTATARPVEGAHTIWELVRHLISWYNEVARRLNGSPAGEPLEGDWPDMADASEIEWARTLADLVDATDRLVEAVCRFPEERWHTPVNDPRNPASDITFFETTEGALQHSAYHAGQIRLLRTILIGK